MINKTEIPGRLLLVFLKEPLPGKVKTRLGSSVGPEEAARRYKTLVFILLTQLRGLKNTRLRVCFAPDEAQDAVKFWLLPLIKEMNGGSITQESDVFQWDDVKGGVDFHAQGEGDLGDRLERAYATGFNEGYESVAAIGSDCLDLGAGWINTAFRRLEGDRELAVGPSPDGGYGFLGISRECSQLFRNIPWSHEETLSKTLEAAKAEGLRYELLPELKDIDTEEDWNALIEGFLGEKVLKVLEGMD